MATSCQFSKDIPAARELWWLAAGTGPDLEPESVLTFSSKHVARARGGARVSTPAWLDPDGDPSESPHVRRSALDILLEGKRCSRRHANLYSHHDCAWHRVTKTVGSTALHFAGLLISRASHRRTPTDSGRRPKTVSRARLVAVFEAVSRPGPRFWVEPRPHGPFRPNMRPRLSSATESVWLVVVLFCYNLTPSVHVLGPTEIVLDVVHVANWFMERR